VPDGSLRLGVVILNWNNSDDTLDCLRSIAEWQPQPAIWIVDNASQDSGVPIARAFPGVQLIQSPTNRGFAGGNNLALSQAIQAGCACVLLLNNDARLAQSDLERLMSVLESDSTIGVVGPVLRERQPPHRILSAGGRDITRHISSHEVDLPANHGLKDVAYVPGTVALVRAALLKQIGLLDEEYFFGGEVADLCERAWQAGYRSAIHARSQALHDVGRSSRMRDSLHAYYVIRNRFLFIRKFRSRQRAGLFAMWSLRGMAMAADALLRGNWRRARAIGLGVWHGLTSRYGGRNEQVWPELRATR